jgi:hypothetical protein
MAEVGRMKSVLLVVALLGFAGVTGAQNISGDSAKRYSWI